MNHLSNGYSWMPLTACPHIGGQAQSPVHVAPSVLLDSQGEAVIHTGKKSNSLYLDLI